MLSTSDIALEDVLPLITQPNLPIESEIWAPLFFPPAPVVDLLNQRKCAKLMREQGFHPKYPLVLIPGKYIVVYGFSEVPNIVQRPR